MVVENYSSPVKVFPGKCLADETIKKTLTVHNSEAINFIFVSCQNVRMEELQTLTAHVFKNSNTKKEIVDYLGNHELLF